MGKWLLYLITVVPETNIPLAHRQSGIRYVEWTVVETANCWRLFVLELDSYFWVFF